MQYEKECNHLHVLESGVSQRDLATSKQMDQLNTTYQFVPRSFLSYLFEIGSGCILGSTISIYSDLLDFYDLGLEDVYSMEPGVRIFGDTFSGDFLGFYVDRPDDQVLEFWHDSNEWHQTGKSFFDYIREIIGTKE